MKTKVYLIIWGSAYADDRGACNAYCGCEKHFYNKERALKALTECKDAYVQGLLEDAEDEEERKELESYITVYGSESEEYYEIDCELFDIPSEHHIRLQEIEIF
jgi:hypothetical protein